MIENSHRFFRRELRQYLRQLVSYSPAMRRLILCQAVSKVVSRRQQDIRLGVFRAMRISHEALPVLAPLFIICTARTGSTLLGDYLNSHPMVTCEFEVLNRGKIPHLGFVNSEKDVRFYLDTLFKALRGKIRCGIIHFPHFDDLGITIDHLLQWFPQARFIVLYRRSLLDQFVSLKLAEATGRWIATSPGDETNQEISIDVAELLAFARLTKHLYVQLADHPLLRGRHLTISYEELASDAHSVFEKKVWPFLDIPLCQIKTMLRKQNLRSSRESVTNFHDVESLLSSGVLEQRLNPDLKYK